MEIHERLKIFFARLRAAPPCRDAADALSLVCELIEKVEDEWCSIPREEFPPRRPTGRMYAPRADSIRTMSDGTIHARSVRHLIICRDDGSILIERLTTPGVAFEKSGAKI